jgi:predicted transcriptional regulator
MTEKGLLAKNRTAYMYAFTREEYEEKKAKDVLDSMYNGSLKKFVAALK